MRDLIAVLALVVAAQYCVIAFAIVPRLARLSQVKGRTLLAVRWGAAAFFVGCAFTHVGIAVANLLPPGTSTGMDDMGSDGSLTGQALTMVVPHVAQIVGGLLFIVISRRHLEVSIVSKSSAQDQRALDRQWRSAFNDAPLGIALLPVGGSDHDGDSYVNPAYRQMFGHEGGDESLRYPAASLRPADRAQVEAAVARIGVGETVQQQLHVVQPDGSTRLIRATLNPVADDGIGARRMTGIFEDITEATAAATDMQSREERFRHLAEGLGVGLSLRQIDPPELLYANSEYLKITGTQSDPGVSEAPETIPNLFDVVHPDDRQVFVDDYWPQVQRGVRATAEVRLVLPRAAGDQAGPGEQVRWVRCASSPVSANQVATTVEDVTANRNAEAAVLSAKAEAEKANLAKSEFLSRMSHELRTPLNAVIGFGQLLELGALTDRQTEAVSHILGGGRHLLAMIDDILDISRIETDQLEVSLESVRTDEVVAEAVALIQPMASAAQVTVEVPVALAAGLAGGAQCVSADRRRLRQVLLNLLSNAVKYNTPGGWARITCTATDDGQVAIGVADSGIGIRAEDLGRLFTPFDRLGQQATEIEGTGIGLALSQRLVSIMGGRMEVRSEHGSGSTFSVVLPAAVEAQDLAHLETPPYEAPAADGGPVSTLLYVEDNLPNVRLMQALVDRRPGWRMVHAGHGGLGWELASSLTPDLVMLDLHLPDMNGIDVLKRIRADARTAGTRVVVVSADANQRQIQRLLEAGADRYLTKPLDIVTMLALLDEYAVARAT